MTATTQLLLFPLFLHLALIGYVASSNLSRRITAVRSGQTKLSDIALDSGNWPPEVLKFTNNYANQFEIPTLWYALCALLIATGKVDIVEIALSWLFIAARLVHAFIHTGSNYVPNRMYAFLSGFAVLVAMWVWFAVRLYLIG